MVFMYILYIGFITFLMIVFNDLKVHGSLLVIIMIVFIIFTLTLIFITYRFVYWIKNKII